MQNLTGHVIRGYELRQLIGVGGFAAVYRAYQPVVERDVAIKVILAKYANNPEFVRRFEAEAQIIARLEHLHIVALYDYWREPNNAYLVMRWLRGGSLYTSLKKNGAWTLQATARLLDQVAAALTVAHRNGVIHRDLTPANILLDEENNAYLADFGIAKEIVESGDPELDDHLYGSPAYMAPERIMRDDPIPQTDIYSLGIVLYEMLTGHLPFEAPTHTTLMRKHLDEPLPPLQTYSPDLPPALNLVIMRAAAKNPEARYADALSLAADFRRAIEAANGDHELPAAVPDHEGELTTQLLDGPEPRHTLILEELLEPQNPYKGLRAFDEADVADFFGRSALVKQILSKLAIKGPEGRFLAVIGPSGSGKSSVVRAGVLPALRKGEIPGSHKWFIAKMVPGAEPFQQLEMALTSVAFDTSVVLKDELRTSEQGLLNVVQRILPRGNTDLVLCIDQFEELFTLVQGEAERAHFLNILRTAVQAPGSRLRVIIALRADFYDRPLLYSGFGELIREHTQVILPLTAQELEEAIVEPARRVGLVLEPGLVEAIIADVSEQPGTLPLLQYALTELFERREGNVLSLAAYRASGGVLGALARRAEDLFSGMSPAYQAAAQQIFLRLVNLGEGTKDTRRRVRWAELISIGKDGKDTLQEVLSQFGKYRLLTFDRDPQTREPVVEVAHEALISEWGRLRDWLDTNREDLRIQQRLAAAASDWMKGGQDSSFLARGAQLAQFEQLANAGRVALSEAEWSYLNASLAQRRRAIRRQRAFIAGLIAFSIVALALALFAFDRQRRAEEAQAAALIARDRADEEARVSRSRELAATARIQLDQVDTALLLSLEALKAADTFEARDSLLTALRYSPYLEAFLPADGSRVRVVTFNPDGIRLAWGNELGQITLWDVETSEVRTTINAHEGAINSLAFSPDGVRLASAGADGLVRLWDAETGEPVGSPLAGHLGAAWSVAYSPDGALLASGGEDSTVIVWDTKREKPLYELSGHEDTVYSVAFSPDGALLASGSGDMTIRLWDVVSGDPVGEPLVGHQNWIFSVAFSPDGALLASGGADHTVMLWEVASGEALYAFEGHTDWVRSIAFSPDGSTLVSASQDHTLRWWDLQTGFLLASPFLGHRDNVWSVSFNPDGHTLASGGWDGRVLLWDTAQPTLTHGMLSNGLDNIEGLAFSPDGRLIAAASTTPLTNGENYGVRLWDVESGKEAAALIGHTAQLTDVEFSPDGALIASAGGDAAIVLWDAASLEQVKALVAPGGNYPMDLAFAPDGTHIGAGYVDGTVIVWDIETGLPVAEPFSGHTQDVFAVAFSPDGRLFVSGSRDGTIIVRDTTTWEPTGEPLVGHSDAVVSIAFSPDGRLLASGSRDTTILLWDTVTWQPVGQPLVGHRDDVLSLAFSPDGRYLVSSSDDQTVILWDVAGRRPLGPPLAGHTNRVPGVAVSPDGALIASGSWDTTIRLWDIGLEVWQADACRIANRNFSPEEKQRYFGDAAHPDICPA